MLRYPRVLLCFYGKSATPRRDRVDEGATAAWWVAGRGARAGRYGTGGKVTSARRWTMRMRAAWRSPAVLTHS